MLINIHYIHIHEHEHHSTPKRSYLAVTIEQIQKCGFTKIHIHSIPQTVTQFIHAHLF